MNASADELPRGFGASTATYVVIASMVGTGILVSPGYMLVSLGSYPVIFGLWILGGLLATCGALCVAELAAALPHAGGEYVYLREAYGPLPAFLSGWTSFIVGFSAPLAVVGHVAAVYLLAPFGETGAVGESGGPVRVAAASVIVLMTVPNLLGHRQSAWTQDLTTMVKLGLFVILVVAAFTVGEGDFHHFTGGGPLSEVDVGDMATQLFYVMFAFSGWNAASYLAGEVKDPGRTLPRSLVIGTACVTALYLAVNAVFAYAVPFGAVDYGNAEQLPRLAVERLFGGRVSTVFSIAVGLTFLATASAFIVTGPRIYYAMARDGLFPSAARRLSGKGKVPAYAMVAQSVCAIGILFAVEFTDLYKYASVGLSAFTLLFIAAVCVLRRKRPDLTRPFRVPGYPLVPLLYLAVTVFMIVFAFIQWPGPSLYCAGTLALGIPVYYLWLRLRQRDSSGQRVRSR